MSDWIEVRVSDFYSNAVGDQEYAYVSREVYDALANTFRREAHAEEMRDLRHNIRLGYLDGTHGSIMSEAEESLEDMVIRQADIEILQKAMQSLTKEQRRRLHFYFFDGLTYRQIGEKLGISDRSVRESIEAALKKIKKFFI